MSNLNQRFIRAPYGTAVHLVVVRGGRASRTRAGTFVLDLGLPIRCLAWLAQPSKIVVCLWQESNLHTLADTRV